MAGEAQGRVRLRSLRALRRCPYSCLSSLRSCPLLPLPLPSASPGWRVGPSLGVPRKAYLCFGPAVCGIDSASSWFLYLGSPMGTPGASHPEQTVCQGP